MSCQKSGAASATMSCVPLRKMRSTHATGIASPGTFNHRVTGGIVRLFRPLLKMNMMAYRIEMSNALFPAGPPEGEVDAPEPSRILFVGDAAVAGYGVLNHGLAVVSQTARYVAREHNTGCSWTAITDTELTMSRASTAVAAVTTDVDVVVVILGPPDVLLGTTAREWSTHLRKLISAVRQGPDPECPVVVAAIPPMYRLNPMPRFVQRILALQIHRLNRSSLQVADSFSGVTYSPFPRLEKRTEFVQDGFNWPRQHSRWGKQLGSTTALALSSRYPTGDGTPGHDD